jgi:hypothetical protein
VPTEMEPKRAGWPQFDAKMLAAACVLTLLAGTYFYLADSQLSLPELFFVLLVCYGVVLAARTLWARVRRRGNGGRHE